MGRFAEKFLNMMRLNDMEDEYEEYEEYDEYDEEAYEEEEDQAEEEELEVSHLMEEAEEKKTRRGFMPFGRREKEVEEPEEPVEEPQGRVIPFHVSLEEGEIVKVIRPQTFNEAQIVADFLKEGKTIVVNLEGIEISQAQRIIDFIGGASFAVDGSLKAISNNIFIVAPGNIEVSGDLRDEIVNDDTLSPELTKF